MIEVQNNGVYIIDQKMIVPDEPKFRELLLELVPSQLSLEDAAQNTITYRLLETHNTSNDMRKLKLRFDSVASHDITYVGIVQTLKACGLKEFPIPYVMTNCHNSLCAVGGTINSDDHSFGLSAAQKYGGIFVPAHLSVIHQYMREMMSGCGSMILGSDSHTRYGSLGTMGFGEGGPELVRQILGETYNIDYPQVVGVYMTGCPKVGVGPQDVALALISNVFSNGLANNSVLEFIGDGIESLDMEFRNGIDVMTTETTCLSSVWKTDEQVRTYYQAHGRENAYKKLEPGRVVYYNSLVKLDLSKIKPMIAMPFHPSNCYTIQDVNENTEEILHEVEVKCRKSMSQTSDSFSLMPKVRNGRLHVDQGIIAGCAGGTFGNLNAVAEILSGRNIGNDSFTLSVYPASQPVNLALIKNGAIGKIMEAGGTVRTAFCGPCFGAGDVPSNNGFSIRHTTRNFMNREGSKPGNGQIASVALMDARSIAATAINGGALTSATDIEMTSLNDNYTYNKEIYANRVYNGFGKPKPSVKLVIGPNITEWPRITPLPHHLLLKVASVILDPVTTTDELIPSGEASSYRSNPLKLAEYTLSRRDPGYVERARQVQAMENRRLSGNDPFDTGEDLLVIGNKIHHLYPNYKLEEVGIGSLIAVRKPGDGSAREQAASCQRILGGWANIANEYATRRYRSNLINWGILPFIYTKELNFSVGEYILIPNIKQALTENRKEVTAYLMGNEEGTIELQIPPLTEEERMILIAGCLMNYYSEQVGE